MFFVLVLLRNPIEAMLPILKFNGRPTSIPKLYRGLVIIIDQTKFHRKLCLCAFNQILALDSIKCSLILKYEALLKGEKKREKKTRRNAKEIHICIKSFFCTVVEELFYSFVAFLLLQFQVSDFQFKKRNLAR